MCQVSAELFIGTTLLPTHSSPLPHERVLVYPHFIDKETETHGVKSHSVKAGEPGSEPSCTGPRVPSPEPLGSSVLSPTAGVEGGMQVSAQTARSTHCSAYDSHHPAQNVLTTRVLVKTRATLTSPLLLQEPIVSVQNNPLHTMGWGRATGHPRPTWGFEAKPRSVAPAQP